MGEEIIIPGTDADEKNIRENVSALRGLMGSLPPISRAEMLLTGINFLGAIVGDLIRAGGDPLEVTMSALITTKKCFEGILKEIESEGKQVH